MPCLPGLNLSMLNTAAYFEVEKQQRRKESRQEGRKEWRKGQEDRKEDEGSKRKEERG